MSTVDTSSWNPDADLNTAIEGIPLNSNAGIAQTWKVVAILMAAIKGDVNAVKAMISVMEGATASADGTSGLVPKPEAGDQDKVLKGNGRWVQLINATQSTSGLMSAADKVFLDSATDRGQLGDGYQLADNIDLNSVLTPGNYTVRGSRAQNSPTGNFCALVVLSSRGTTINQLLLPVGSRGFRRTWDGTSWSAWKTLIEADAPPASSASSYVLCGDGVWRQLASIS